MHLTKKIKLIFPFIILLALFGIFWRELFYAKPNELPSVLIGEPLPSFRLPTLFLPGVFLTQQDMPGHASLLNVWATWCYACQKEHDMLLKIKEIYHVPIYGIAYKDNPEEAKEWLGKFGNPYVKTGSDRSGNVAIDLGVYGTPETFVINKHGKIIYRHVGAIDQATWDKVLYPLIIKLENET